MCSVFGCDSWRRSAYLFKLPEDPDRRLLWVQFLFRINGQRVKEWSWTNITICSEHFSDDFLINVFPSDTPRLKSNAVPSLCMKSEPEEFETCQEPVENTEVPSQSKLEKCDSPSSCSYESEISLAAQGSPVQSDNSDDFFSDYGQMLQKVANIDTIREKASLLRMKKKYVVSEKALLQSLKLKCPVCGSNVKVEKFIRGVLVILNQQCLQCEYRNQWKNQANASFPEPEDEEPTGGVDVTPEIKATVSTHDNNSVPATPEEVAINDEESDSMDEKEESVSEVEMDSGEEWTPMDTPLLDSEFESNESDEDSESYDDDPLVTSDSELCTECGKFFNKRHPHTCVHKIKPYSCNICGKRCVNEASLFSHSIVHDANYEHKCKYCYATFKTKADKRSHEQTHVTEEKPYQCPHCSEAFTKYKQRRNHLVVHKGVPLKCDICGIEFYRASVLQRHLAVHTGEKRYKCSVCQRGFNQAGHLKSHMRLHTGERPYKCQHCNKCFNHNVSLKSHIQRYHTANSGQENGENSETDNRPKRKRLSTGRPKGRPKKRAAHYLGAEENKGKRPNRKTTKRKLRKSKRGQCSDED